MRTDHIQTAVRSLEARLGAVGAEEHEHTHVCLDCGVLEVASCGVCGSYAHNEDVLLGRGLLDDVAAIAREWGVPLEEGFRLLLLGGLVLAGRGDGSAVGEVARFLVGERQPGLRLVSNRS